MSESSEPPLRSQTFPPLPSWRQPDGGIERLLIPTRHERRRRPMSRREVLATRLAVLLSAALFGIAFGLGGSMWRLIAISLPISSCIWFLMLTGYQRRQFLGLKPPADSIR